MIVTSPPYADSRAKTYGGIKPGRYVEWFLPRSEQFLRTLKPTGTFILNIKERVVNSERHTYVIELILEMRRQGWLWTEEFIWHNPNTVWNENELSKMGCLTYHWFINAYEFCKLYGHLWIKHEGIYVYEILKEVENATS